MSPPAYPGPTVTIGQLAAYAGVTTRAIRHYHHAGLLPEPDRDVSGYRIYDAVAVVRLIRIRTLARAGVPLARVHEMLDARPEEFTAAIAQIDDELRRKIRELQEHRRQIVDRSRSSTPAARWPCPTRWSTISTGYEVSDSPRR